MSPSTLRPLPDMPFTEGLSALFEVTEVLPAGPEGTSCSIGTTVELFLPALPSDLSSWLTRD